MVSFSQSRCKFANAICEINRPSKSKGRKTVVQTASDPYEKLSTVDQQKLCCIEKYKTSVRIILMKYRNRYVSALTDLLSTAIFNAPEFVLSQEENSEGPNQSFLSIFVVRISSAISDSSFVYTKIFNALQDRSQHSNSTIVRLNTLNTETLPLLFTEIAKHVFPDISKSLSSCSFELLLKLLNIKSSSPFSLILLFEKAEQIPISVLSTAMQLFGQSFTVTGVTPLFVLGVTSAESWHKLHTSLPLRACKNVSFHFLSVGGKQATLTDCPDDVDAPESDLIEETLLDLIVSERFPLKLGSLCTNEILTWLRDGRLNIAVIEKIFAFVAQNQICNSIAEDSDIVVKLLPDSIDYQECFAAPSRQRSGGSNVRGCLCRLYSYWIDIKAACYVMRLIESTVMASNFNGGRKTTSILEIYRMVLESNLAQTRWCSRVLMSLGTLSEIEFDRLLLAIINTLNQIKSDTKTLDLPGDQRPNFLLLLDICIEMRHQFELHQKEVQNPQPNVSVFATPSASKAGNRKTMLGLFGTPQTSSLSYFEHQARLRAEIKSKKVSEEETSNSTSTPGGSTHKFGARPFANQLRDWLYQWVPNKSKVLSGDAASYFYFDDLYLLCSSFNPDMNELLSGGLSSKSIRQHLTLKVPAYSDFDVHVLFSVFTSSSVADSMASTAPLNQWYAAFSEVRRLRTRKADPPIDDKEMQARFVSALDELETRGLLRYNPPRRTITKLFECEEDDDIL